MKKTMIALKDFYYAMKDVKEGDDVEIEEKDIHILMLAQAVKEKEEARQKRTYKRRDMTAEDIQP